ncbi:MAG: hypothetical protein RBU37_05040 [Myxococcota bacterium]|jgi:hypothetical protein|nr:hypothetical protein [Myxococcota bacterium]
MPRSNTLNFFQIENGLRHARESCKDSGSGELLRQLDEAAFVLEQASARADSAYLAWREAIRLRLLAAKRLGLRFDGIRAELAELDVPAQPRGRVSYWQPELLLDAVQRLCEQVQALPSSENLVDSEDSIQWNKALESGAEELRAALRHEERCVEDYRRVAPLRRIAFARAQDAVDDFEALTQDEE